MSAVTMLEQVLAAVPIGEANAQGASDIWQQVDCWAKTTVRQQLMQLAGAGEIRQTQRSIPSGFMRVYWRDPP